MGGHTPGSESATTPPGGWPARVGTMPALAEYFARIQKVQDAMSAEWNISWNSMRAGSEGGSQMPERGERS
jgi:hypothetical protein